MKTGRVNNLQKKLYLLPKVTDSIGMKKYLVSLVQLVATLALGCAAILAINFIATLPIQ